MNMGVSLFRWGFITFGGEHPHINQQGFVEMDVATIHRAVTGVVAFAFRLAEVEDSAIPLDPGGRGANLVLLVGGADGPAKGCPFSPLCWLGGFPY